jgi:hypothetical protein
MNKGGYMNRSKVNILFFVIALTAFIVNPVFGQKKALKSITGAELRTHLSFIASDELEGRNTPSKGLKTAARYIASQVESYGLKPMMDDGNFLQVIPLETRSVSMSRTVMTVHSLSGDKAFSFPKDFSASTQSEGMYFAGLEFLGFGLSAPDLDWDDVGDRDLSGKIVVILNGTLPDNHPVNSRENRRILFRKTTALREAGAIGVLQVIDPETEKEMNDNDEVFPMSESVSWPSTTQGGRGGSRFGGGSSAPFLTCQIRHSVAEAILGVSVNEIEAMFALLQMGVRVNPLEIPNKKIDIQVGVKMGENRTQNIVAKIEGSDPVLKNEYVCIGSHYDHTGVTRNGEINNGADDDGSGTVAMLEIAQAMTIERPKRSVIFVWHTGEEKGLRGARYFVENSPVPLEKITAQLQMDMISRNHTDSIYVIGSHFLSKELDQAVNKSANNLKNVFLSQRYNYNIPPGDRSMPNNYFRQSDHYPYYQVGIPVIFYFCGTHEDLHRPTDTYDRCDYGKMERVTRLVYYTAMEVGSRKDLLPLNVMPEFTSRGKHNIRR